jgi:hypothetical protein
MIKTIAIPTKGRPATFKRTLLKYIEDTKANSREVEFMVLDGSTKAADRNEIKVILKEVEHDHLLNIRYLSNREVEGYQKKLVNAGVDEEVVAQLQGKSVGSMRNIVLLETIGSQLMFVDDDTQPKLARKKAPQMAVFRQNSEASELATDPTACWFYESRGEALTDRKLEKATDPVGMLAATLGKPAESLWPEFRDQGLLVKGDRERGTVLATTLGVYGDPAGLTWGGYLKLLGGLTRAGVRAGAPVDERGILRVPVEEVIQTGPYFPTHAFALDHSKQLPPFPPFENPKDGLSGSSLYGILLGLMYSNAFISHRPWAIYHDPPGTRKYADHVVPLSIRDLVIHASEGIPKGAAGRLQKLADSLVALEEPSGVEWIANAVEARSEALSEEMSTRAAALGQPDLYAEAQSGENDFPRDKARKALIGFGKLLRGWSSLIQTAKVLKDQGTRASVVL